MCEGPEETRCGIELRQQQQALPQQQEDPAPQPRGTSTLKGSHRSSPGPEALQKTWGAPVAGEGAGQSKGQGWSGLSTRWGGSANTLPTNETYSVMQLVTNKLKIQLKILKYISL